MQSDTDTVLYGVLSGATGVEGLRKEGEVGKSTFRKMFMALLGCYKR